MTETATTETKAPRTKKAATSKVVKTKAPKAETKAAKPKREKRAKEDTMVFAFRLPKAESAALHRSAGPANASRVMRQLAAAFVTGDRAQFESIVAEAAKLR